MAEVITLSASARYGQRGQFVARIVGRDAKFTFEREFLGRREGTRGESTSVLVDEPGLYQTRNVDSNGRREDRYRLVWADGNGLAVVEIAEELAMQLAKDDLDANRAGREAARAKAEDLLATCTARLAALVDRKDDETVFYAGKRWPIGARRDDLAQKIDKTSREIARLRGAPDREALEAELVTLRARIAAIEATLIA